MNAPLKDDLESEQRRSAQLLDVLIRAGLIAALVVLCYKIFAPFLTLMVWALILAVAMYPLHQMLARKLGGKQGLAATLIALFGAALIVTPTALLLGSLADSVQQLVHDVQDNTLQVPAPRPGVAEWPVVGPKLHAVLERGARRPAGPGAEVCSRRSGILRSRRSDSSRAWAAGSWVSSCRS